MLRALSNDELELIAGGLESQAELDNGFDDGSGDGGDGGGGDGGGGDPGGLGDQGGWSLPPGPDYPDPSQVLNYPSPSGSSPPSLGAPNPTPTGPTINVGGGVSVTPGFYGSPTSPSGGGVTVGIKF